MHNTVNEFIVVIISWEFSARLTRSRTMAATYYRVASDVASRSWLGSRRIYSVLRLASVSNPFALAGLVLVNTRTASAKARSYAFRLVFANFTTMKKSCARCRNDKVFCQLVLATCNKDWTLFLNLLSPCFKFNISVCCAFVLHYHSVSVTYWLQTSLCIAPNEYDTNIVIFTLGPSTHIA